ncbi:hypothetical protein [Mangrovimonas sp. ST2L15]|uniref:hypothetical protein n=1 Tax=Mangrovimonas sp. ST2L15 TaxID=1645916 RepID=UPI0006B5F9AF|nr:hypothetical protein [Mangrovimonas sp. ST2L15]
MTHKQFTFRTTKPEQKQHCSIVTIDNYYLQFSNDLNYTFSEYKGTSIHLLGNLFDYIRTEASNQELLDTLANQQSKEDFFKMLNTFYGEYVLIHATQESLIVLNDCCAQREVYYTEDYKDLASELHFISSTWEHPKNHAYYNSKLYDQKKLFIGTTTPDPSINHLSPNHYLDLLNKKTVRFFPFSKITPQSINDVANKAALMLKGYIKAIANRHPIILPVTGGFDSRLLFLASLSTECDYFVFQHDNMNESHYDIQIAKKLTHLFNKKLHVIEDGATDITSNKNNSFKTDYQKFIPGKVIINGNISEVARNFFNYIKPVSGIKLAVLNGFSTNNFVTNHYDQWLTKNQRPFETFGYNMLDMFYWEEKMSNWAARSKTENSKEGLEVMSPFNSRALLELLLSTKRKDRDKYTSKLYQKIIENLATNHKTINGIPTNPDFERKKAMFLKKIGLFQFYDEILLKVRILKRKI